MMAETGITLCCLEVICNTSCILCLPLGETIKETVMLHKNIRPGSEKGAHLADLAG